MSFTPSFLFKQIFPTSEDFLAKITPELFSVDLSDEEKKAYAIYVYNVCYRRYANFSIAYDTPEAFVRQFAGIFEDVFERYRMIKRNAEKIYSLTDAEIEEIRSAIINSANNPNTAPNDPRAPLQYISLQSQTFQNNGKLIAYAMALQSAPTIYQGELLKEFAGLFRRMCPVNYYFYAPEEE